MSKYIQPGDVLTLTATALVVSGQGVQTGQIFSVAQGDAQIGITFEGKMTGVFSLPKNGAQALTEGALVYWDGTEITTSASGNLLVGTAALDAAAPDATASIRLDGTARPQEP